MERPKLSPPPDLIKGLCFANGNQVTITRGEKAAFSGTISRGVVTKPSVPKPKGVGKA